MRDTANGGDCMSGGRECEGTLYFLLSFSLNLKLL